MGRRLFTAEFKRECAELVLKQNYKVKDAAEAMNIGQSTLQRWMRQYKEEQLGVTPKATAINGEHRRVQQLEAQV
jgi:transposase